MRIKINIRMILMVMVFLTLALFSFKEEVFLEKGVVASIALADEKQEYTESIATRIFTFEDVFTETDIPVTFTNATTLKNSPNEDGKNLKNVVKYDTATLIGTNDFTYWKIKYDGRIYYVDRNCITSSTEEVAALKRATYNNDWYGPVLNSRLGTVQGPTGKETYYNLDMSGVIAIMRRCGNNEIYWIREDGVKMLGDYVMVAANLNLYPRGSLVECSLGIGIVCDTGGFASRNPTQLDIAVNW
ncbi:MAG: hypothetical protein Q4C64_05115 [Erysipelotrichia bacterium]|nr:hypothetical protein [Erysipelotrichia bacterium]